MPRTRVHNMNISLDGYAAGEHVTLDAPIGGAERLFKWFDGRVIHGVDKADAPVTLDRALTSMWSQGEVLRLAQEAAGGRDVRIGGGPSTLRQFLQAGLVDFMHLVIVPITLGCGISLWEGTSGLEDHFTVESVTSPSGLTHQLWNKNDHV